MGIKKFYSLREKKHWKYDAKLKQHWSWGYDIRLAGGKRVRESGFSSESDAIAAVGKIRAGEKDKKFGFIPEAARPSLQQLIDKHLTTILNPREKVRSRRVLSDFIGQLKQPQIKVNDVTTAGVLLYVEKRRRDVLKPQSIDRELNIIGATLNAAQNYYPQLAQWAPPRMPRPKKSKARRERIITDGEKVALLEYLFAPRKEGERSYQAAARRRVGLQVQFALLTGLRHAEMDRIKKSDIDWRANSLKIIGRKIEKVSNPTRYIAPLTSTMISILREACDRSRTDYVFTRSGNTTPKFYKILRAACVACEISYGRYMEGGLVLHDARHTATTRMLQGGIDLSTIQSFTGHSDKTMVLYYSHATPESRARAAAVLEGYAGNSNPGPGALSTEQIVWLSSLVAIGKLSPERLTEIIRGQASIPEELTSD